MFNYRITAAIWLLRDKLNELSIRVDLSLVRISLCTGQRQKSPTHMVTFDSLHLAFPSHNYPLGPPVMDKWRLVGGLVRRSVCLYCQSDGGQ